ncbi:MAG: rhomboid family intramembrane serine protease [Negativicutes bacterium]|nr:rhomboid family intramembrane serine protease [Negativicutes bacterium]
MIPIRDNIRSGNFPLLAVALIIANFYVFYQELQLSSRGLNAFILTYGLIPSEFLSAISRDPLSPASYFPLLSNLFLHGGWMHIIGNMWYIWIFGDNIEDRLGHIRFLGFYIACGVIANLAHVAFDPASAIPTIGASGAVSGILGAYLVTFPWAKVLTVVPILFFIQIIEIPAIIFLGLWFFIQLQYGTMSLMMAGANIAWWAHIGGFLAGMALVKFFAPARVRWRY